uniref:Uncharacterized protein n=1 Tax=Strigamia maritima TaxID=126957 RepID=T1IX71_STRMM
MRSDYALLSTELFLLWLLTTMRCYNNCSFYINLIPSDLTPYFAEKYNEIVDIYLYSAAALLFVALIALVCAIIKETAKICWIWLIIIILFWITELIFLILRFITEPPGILFVKN